MNRAQNTRHRTDIESQSTDVTRPGTVLSWLCGVCLFSFVHEIFLPITPYLPSIHPSADGQSAGPVIWLMGGVAIGCLTGGSASDQLGRRTTILSFLLITCLGSLISLVFDNSWFALLGGRLLVGLGAGAALVVCRVALRETCTISTQLIVSSYLSISVTLTTVAAPLLGILAYGVNGLHGVLSLTVVASILVLIVVYSGFTETQRTTPGKASGRARLHEAVRLLGDLHFLLITLTVTLGWVIFVLFGTSLPTLLQLRFGFDRQEYAYVIAAVYLAYFLGIRGSQWMLRRIAPYRQIMISASSLALMLGVVAVFVVGNSLSAHAFVVVVVCVYVLLGFVLPLGQSLVMRDRYSNFGLVASVFYFVELLGGAAALWAFSNFQGDLFKKLAVAGAIITLGLALAGRSLASLANRTPALG